MKIRKSMAVGCLAVASLLTPMVPAQSRQSKSHSETHRKSKKDGKKKTVERTGVGAAGGAVVGGLIGGFIMRSLGFEGQGGTIYTIIVAIAGACLLTFVFRLITGRRTAT